MDERTQAERAILVAQSEATNFAIFFINDNQVRQRYLRETLRYSKEMLEALRRGELTPFEAAKQANELRNELMRLSRLKLSGIGLADSQKAKAQGTGLIQSPTREVIPPRPTAEV